MPAAGGAGRRSTRSSTAWSATSSRTSPGISHPGYLAFIPGEGTWPGALGDLIASALNVDTCWWLGASGPSALELVVLDWFRQWVGYPEEAAGVLVSGGSAANLTALACAREARIGADGRARGRVHVRPDALVARARGTRARLPARPGAGDPDRPRGADPPRRARGARSPPTVAGGRKPLAGGRQRRHDGHRARSTRSASSRRSAASRGSGSTSTAPTAPSPCLSERGREALAGIELGRLDHARPAQVALPAGRAGRAARARRRGAPARLRDLARLPQGRRGGRSRGELLRSRPAAHPHLPRAQALDLAALLRRGGVSRRRSTAASTSRSTRSARIEASPELELMSPASLGIVTFRRHPAGVDDEAVARAHQREPGRRRSSAAARSSSRPAGCAGATCCGCASSTTRRRRPRSTARSSWRRRSRSTSSAGASVRGARELSAASRPAGCAGRPLDAEALRSLPLFASLDDEHAERVLRTRTRAPRPGRRGDRRAVAGQPRPLRRAERRRGGRRRRPARWRRSARATSSASWRRSTGEPASRAPARPPSLRPSRRGCSSSTGCSSTG